MESWGVDVDSSRVPAQPTIDTVRYAHDERNLTIYEIARVTGLVKQTVSDIYHGRRKNVTKSTERRVLAAYGPGAVTVRNHTKYQLIDSKDYHWKVRALYAQGWTSTDMRTKLKAAGRPHTSFTNSMTGTTQMRWQTAEQIDWLVQEIGDRHGPSPSNTGRMARRGIFPLIHYTEDGKLIRASLTSKQLEAWVR